ncbi:unnamed protein product [Ectocarpus sp. 12 AP-2014]
MGVLDVESARQYVWNLPEMYREWWLNLVREDPGHVVVETTLIAFIVYILFFKKTLNPKVPKALRPFVLYTCVLWFCRSTPLTLNLGVRKSLLRVC